MKNNQPNYPMASWVLLLRFIAGFINAIAIIFFAQMLAGHTGSLTNAAINFVEGDFVDMFKGLAIVFSFFIGTVISGYFFPGDRFRARCQYGMFFLITGGMTLIFNRVKLPPILFLIYLALILGLQNGMFVFYRGLIVRTTILTGTLTDIGTMLGRKLHGQDIDEWKLIFHTINVVVFMIGAGMAMAIHLYSNGSVILMMGFIQIGIGIYFFAMRKDTIQSIEDSMRR